MPRNLASSLVGLGIGWAPRPMAVPAPTPPGPPPPLTYSSSHWPQEPGSSHERQQFRGLALPMFTATMFLFGVFARAAFA